MPFVVDAAGLGELNVVSRLGEPLHAEIEIIAAPGERIEDSCFRFGQSRSDDGDIPRITQGRMSVKQTNGGRRLVVTTPSAMREPLLQMAVRIACGNDLVRDYALLLSPPERRAPAVTLPAAVSASAGAAPASPATSVGVPVDAPTQTPRSMGRALYPHSRRLQRQFAEALIGANPGLGLAGDTPIPKGVALALPDMRQSADRAPVAPATAVAPPMPPAPRAANDDARKPKASARRQGLQVADRLMISGGDQGTAWPGDPVLRLATELSSAAVAGVDISSPDRAGVSEVLRDVFRIEYRLLAGMAEQSRASLDSAERKRWVQQSAADFRRLADYHDGKTPGAEAVPLPAPEKRAAAEARAAALPPPAPAAVGPSRAGPAAVDSVLYGGLFAAFAAVTGFLWHKRRREFRASNGIESISEVAAANFSASDIYRAPSDADHLPVADAGDRKIKDLDFATTAVADSAADPAAAGTSPAIPPELRSTAPPLKRGADVEDLSVDVEVEEDAGGILELAEIMLAFGRVKGAAETLREFVENNPKQALQPWIKLLNVYRANGMRNEFEDISVRLNKTYNVQIESWDAADGANDPESAADAQRGNVDARSLDCFPRIVSEIARLWGTKAGVEYLQKLLHDNRDGERIGFRREVAEEILLLGDVLAERLRLAA